MPKRLSALFLPLALLLCTLSQAAEPQVANGPVPGSPTKPGKPPYDPVPTPDKDPTPPEPPDETTPGSGMPTGRGPRASCSPILQLLGLGPVTCPSKSIR
ncbi:hypothetical protein [Chitinimonas lacunae]|uniref:Uncharacterized protein n=1 Tax=Chitinimonas lacunae TaxID=1963018 RepID=A0ABV8MPV2_9NEIS